MRPIRVPLRRGAPAGWNHADIALQSPLSHHVTVVLPRERPPAFHVVGRKGVSQQKPDLDISEDTGVPSVEPGVASFQLRVDLLDDLASAQADLMGSGPEGDRLPM